VTADNAEQARPGEGGSRLRPHPGRATASAGDRLEDLSLGGAPADAAQDVPRPQILLVSDLVTLSLLLEEGPVRPSPATAALCDTGWTRGRVAQYWWQERKARRTGRLASWVSGVEISWFGTAHHAFRPVHARPRDWRKLYLSGSRSW
jgi:hypothetical protein